MTRPRAALDSGTNSTRLLVVDADGREVARRSTITRLGAHVDATGALDPVALQRTLDVIDQYRGVWVAAGVASADVRVVATSAVRDAANRDEYFTAVHDLTGVQARVLTGGEEARLSFAGAARAVGVDSPVLVVDIGGGSTELIVGEASGRVVAAHSMQVGAVRVSERHLADDPPTAVQVGEARRMIAGELDVAEGALAIAGGALSLVRGVVGVAGTVTTLAALARGLGSPDDPAVHGTRMGATEVDEWTRRLLACTTAERAAFDAVDEGRADVIAAGALVLDTVLARVDPDEVVVSLADILDGLVATIA